MGRAGLIGHGNQGWCLGSIAVGPADNRRTLVSDDGIDHHVALTGDLWVFFWIWVGDVVRTMALGYYANVHALG